MPTLEVIVPVRPGARDQFPPRLARGVRSREVVCEDGNLARLWRVALAQSSADAVLFKHSDFWLRGWESFEAQLWPLLGRYPVVGVAGTRYFSPRRPCWWGQVAARPGLADGVNRGMVAYPHPDPLADQAGTEPGGYVARFYGPPGPVVVLDGCCVAVGRDPQAWDPFPLDEVAGWWDPEFGRHLYD